MKAPLLHNNYFHRYILSVWSAGACPVGFWRVRQGFLFNPWAFLFINLKIKIMKTVQMELIELNDEVVRIKSGCSDGQKGQVISIVYNEQLKRKYCQVMWFNSRIRTWVREDFLKKDVEV